MPTLGGRSHGGGPPKVAPESTFARSTQKTLGAQFTLSYFAHTFFPEIDRKKNDYDRESTRVQNSNDTKTKENTRGYQLRDRLYAN